MKILISEDIASKLLTLPKLVAASFTDTTGTFPDGFHGHAEVNTAWDIGDSLWVWVMEDWNIDMFDRDKNTEHRFRYYLEIHQEEED